MRRILEESRGAGWRTPTTPQAESGWGDAPARGRLGFDFVLCMGDDTEDESIFSVVHEVCLGMEKKKERVNSGSTMKRVNSRELRGRRSKSPHSSAEKKRKGARAEDAVVNTVCVGRHTSGAQCYVDDTDEVLEVLQALSRTSSMRKSSSTTLLSRRTPRRFFGTMSPIRSTTSLMHGDDPTPSFDIATPGDSKNAETASDPGGDRDVDANLLDLGRNGGDEDTTLTSEYMIRPTFITRNPMKGSPSTDQVVGINKAMREAVGVPTDLNLAESAASSEERDLFACPSEIPPTAKEPRVSAMRVRRDVADVSPLPSPPRRSTARKDRFQTASSTKSRLIPRRALCNNFTPRWCINAIGAAWMVYRRLSGRNADCP